MIFLVGCVWTLTYSNNAITNQWSLQVSHDRHSLLCTIFLLIGVRNICQKQAKNQRENIILIQSMSVYGLWNTWRLFSMTNNTFGGTYLHICKGTHLSFTTQLNCNYKRWQHSCTKVFVYWHKFWDWPSNNDTYMYVFQLLIFFTLFYAWAHFYLYHYLFYSCRVIIQHHNSMLFHFCTCVFFHTNIFCCFPFILCCLY